MIVDMWCLSDAESTDWSRTVGRPGKALRPPVRLGKHAVIVPLSDFRWPRLTWFSTFMASSVEPFNSCLLWVTEWGVWPSSENWHQFYRLRESYGERRLLHDAPGHLFLQHEAADLATFVGIALLSGWDFYLLPNTQYVTVFASHDEFVHFHTDEPEAAERIQQSLVEAKVECSLEAGGTRKK